MLPGKRTNDGALYVTQGPPPAGTPLVGGIAVSHTGVIYVSQSFAFSPADLFAAGEQGAWYDPSDFSTMFQDSTGTTPVTAVGQPVGLILDKSGRGNHASQATAAARPLLQNDGVNNYLAFDGVDDNLATASIVWNTNKLTAFAGVLNNSNAGIASTFGSGDWNTRNTFECFAPFDATGKFEFGWQGSIGYAWRETGAMSTGSPHALTGAIDGDGTTTATEVPTFRIDAADQTKTGGSDADNTQNIATNPLYISCRAGSSLYFNGRIYSLIILCRLATTQEITDTETWVADKTGVVLP